MENTNTNNGTALLWFAGLFFAFLIIVGIAMYLSERFKDINYAKMELCRAYDKDEYRYWRRELTICRLTIIPFMSYERAKRIVRFFSRGRHAKKEKHNDGLTGLLLPSFLGIIICAVCLAGGTFAWFTASQTTATQTIVAANYTVGIEVFDQANQLVGESNTIALSEGTYTVKLTASGDATTGYCILDFGDDIEPKYTEQIAKGENITLNLVVNESVELTITSVWGTYTGERIIDRRCTYGTDDGDTSDNTDKEDEQPSAIPEQTDDDGTYIVKSGDTLSGIASKYKTTVKKLKVYNNLTSNTIQIGQKLNIPPADYEIAKEESATTEVKENEQTPTESDTTAAEEIINTIESDSTSTNVSN